VSATLFGFCGFGAAKVIYGKMNKIGIVIKNEEYKD
jgi:hypothetical protein